MKRSGPLKRKAMKRKPAPQGFPEETRMFVRRRSGGRCEVQTAFCTGEGQHFHHRKLRRHKDHSAVNCLYACRAEHDLIHSYVDWAYRHGLLVHEWADPAEVAVVSGCGVDCTIDHVLMG